MSIILAILAGAIIGGGFVAWQLSQRWRQQVLEAQQTLEDIAARHEQEVQASKQLQQQVADLQFQLNQARNDLRAAQKPATPS